MLHRVYIQPVYVEYGKMAPPDMFIEVFPNASALNRFTTHLLENPNAAKELYVEEDSDYDGVVHVWLGSVLINTMEDDFED